jgi:ferredoxin
LTAARPLQWHESRCTRFRYRYSECRRCADACPHDAITLHDAGARVDADRCRRCALCIDACHVQAWESASYQPIAMLREAIKVPQWHVACAPSGADGDAVLPCLGALGPVPMAYLARRGIALHLHGAWHCDQCEHGARGADRVEANLQAVTALREAVARDGDTPWTMPSVVAGAPDSARRSAVTVSGARRRHLLRRLVARAGDEIAEAVQEPPVAAAPTAPPDKAIRAGSYHVPEPRDLLQIVCQRTDASAVQVPIDESLPLLQLTLHAGCTACEACFRVCPTGAIGIDENPGDWALTFQADRCVGCQVCLEVCQPRVLDAQPATELRPGAQPVRLLGLGKQRCSRCDRFFVSAQPQAQCSICTDDEDAFTAIFG